MTRYRIAFTIIVLVLCCVVPGLAQTAPKTSHKAKITKAEATKTALAKVPGGTVKESELEREKGRLIWSFDIATKDSANITEVQVDANTGEVVSVEQESAKAEADEKQAEQKKQR